MTAEHNTDLDADALAALERTAISHRYSEARSSGPANAPHRYDFTALSTARTCPRRYVLEHGLGLPAELGMVSTDERGDSQPFGDPADRLPNPVRVGTLFHLIVEQYWPTTEPISTWKRRAAAVADARGWADCIPRVETLIDAFADNPVADWQIEPAHVEANFEFDIDGRTVTGAIDAIPVTNDGRAVVLDYKTGQQDPADEQLLVYLLAAHRDESLDPPAPPVDAAFLRATGDSFELDALEVRDLEATLATAEDTLEEWIQTADTASYTEPRPGDHCTVCPYRGVCEDAGNR
jgi:hypothetical protein